MLMLGWSLLDTISPYPKIVMDDCPYWGSFVCEYDLRATCTSLLKKISNTYVNGYLCIVVLSAEMYVIFFQSDIKRHTVL